MSDAVRKRRWVGAATAVGGGVVIVGAGVRYGLPFALLLVACGLLVLVVWLIWTSVLSLGGETELTLDEALSLMAPRAEEEQKRSVLRALKDLEYERRVGKVSEEDYGALSGRFREEAKALLLELDRDLDAARRAAERRVAQHMQAASSPCGSGRKARKVKGKAKRAVGAPPVAEVEARVGSGPSRRCDGCGYRNALELAECASCSRPLAAEGSALCRACPAVYAATLAECPTCGVAREDA